MDSFKAFQAWLEQDFTMRTDYSRQFYTMLHNNQEWPSVPIATR